MNLPSARPIPACPITQQSRSILFIRIKYPLLCGLLVHQYEELRVTWWSLQIQACGGILPATSRSALVEVPTWETGPNPADPEAVETECTNSKCESLGMMVRSSKSQPLGSWTCVFVLGSTECIYWGQSTMC